MGKDVSIFLSIFILSLGCAFFLAFFLDEYVSLLVVLTGIGSVIITLLIWNIKKLKDLNEIVKMLRKVSNK